MTSKRQPRKKVPRTQDEASLLNSTASQSFLHIFVSFDALFGDYSLEISSPKKKINLKKSTWPAQLYIPHLWITQKFKYVFCKAMPICTHVNFTKTPGSIPSAYLVV